MPKTRLDGSVSWRNLRKEILWMRRCAMINEGLKADFAQGKAEGLRIAAQAIENLKPNKSKP